jgi:hypothetical protein
VEGEGVAESALKKEGGANEPSVNRWQEGCQQVGDMLLPEEGKELR